MPYSEVCQERDQKEGTNHRREGTRQDDCMICDVGEAVESSHMIVGSQETLRLTKGMGEGSSEGSRSFVHWGNWLAMISNISCSYHSLWMLVQGY